MPSSGVNYKIGKYVVYVNEFEKLCNKYFESLDDETLLVIDEIGKMELLSKKFDISIQMLLSNENFKILATVPLKSEHPLVNQFKNHPNSKLFHITKSNRIDIFPEIYESVNKLIK